MPSVEFLLPIGLIILTFLLTRREYPFPKSRWVVIALTLFTGIRYLYWRKVYTINRVDNISQAISWLVYSAEIFGFISLMLFLVKIVQMGVHHASSPKEDRLPRIDFFVTVLNEPMDILYKSLVGCTSLDYPPHLLRVYVLDDGYRSCVRVLAERLGCLYLTRPNHKDGKTGNLNYGLAHSSAEFVAVLDCDHIPVRSFLKDTIGFFKDVKVAYVQTPHNFFYNDTSQCNSLLEREILNERLLFFYVTQPAKDRFNASLFTGNGAVFRRSSLQEIGGFQTKTADGDLQTSLVLHSKGYKSVYLNKILIVRFAPETYRSYFKQTESSIRGGAQILLLDNPLWKRGLSIMQRVSYLESMTHFLHYWARLIYLIAPLSYLLMNRAPLNATLPDFLNYFIPYYIISQMVFSKMSMGHRTLFWSDVHETLMCFFISLTVFTAFVVPKKNKYLTPLKGIQSTKSQLEWPVIVPHILLASLIVTGFAVGGYRGSQGDINHDAALLSSFWNLYNLMIVMGAIVLARERIQNRFSPRIFRSLKCKISFRNQSISGTTSDLSETGLSLISKDPPPLFFPTEDKIKIFHASPNTHSPAFRLSLPPDVKVQLIGELGESTELKGEVVRYDLLPFGKISIGIRFLQIKEGQRQCLIRQIYCVPEFWEEVRQKSAKISKYRRLATSFSFQIFFKEKIARRLSPRFPRRFKCELRVGERMFKGETEDISYRGASLRLASKEAVTKNVELFIYNRSLIFRTQGEIVHCSKVRGKGLIYGIRFLTRQDPELALFLSKKF